MKTAPLALVVIRWGDGLGFGVVVRVAVVSGLLRRSGADDNDLGGDSHLQMPHGRRRF